MSVRILFFGYLVEKTGRSSMHINNHNLVSDSEGLKKFLYSEFPHLEGQIFKIAINRELINKKREINDGDEVALMPPYAGG